MTPGSVVGAFFDPGAASLANAQSRAQAAVTRLSSTGDEVATQIRAAAAQTSGEKPGIEWWEQVLRFPDTFIWNGVGGQLIDTLVGVWEMLPVHYMFDDWFNGGNPWWEQYGELWGGIIGAIVSDPLGALEAMWLDFIAADHWDEYAGEGTGRVFTNVVMLLAGGLGFVRILKNLKGLKNAGALSKIDPYPLIKPRPLDASKPGANLVPDAYSPLGRISPHEFVSKHWSADTVNHWDNSTGGWRYPPDNGFDLRRGTPVVAELPAGYRFDRFGGTAGDFVSPEGTSFPSRAIPPDSLEKPYHVYEVVKLFDSESGKPLGGMIAPAFEQPGGGIQYKLPRDVQWLLDNGYIKEVFQ